MNLSASLSAASRHTTGSSYAAMRQRDWDELPNFNLPAAEVLKKRLPAGFAPRSLAGQQFDVLRTRMLGVTEQHGWSGVGITQPKGGPAAAYATMNLALSLARRASLKVLVIDLDLRFPRVAQMMGLSRAPDLGKALRVGADLRAAAGRIGDNLAIVCNAVQDSLSAETLQDPKATESISRLMDDLAPDITLLLLAPVLGGDAGLSGLAKVETVLMVSDGLRTVPADLKECDRLMEGGPPILGVVLVDAEQ